jgi:hypothetical protein
MPSPTRRSKSKYNLIVSLDKEDRRTLREVTAHEKLSLSDTIRRLIRAEARRIQTEKQRSTV